jgi:hypothetical protein
MDVGNVAIKSATPALLRAANVRVTHAQGLAAVDTTKTGTDQPDPSALSQSGRRPYFRSKHVKRAQALLAKGRYRCYPPSEFGNPYRQRDARGIHDQKGSGPD